MNQSPLVRNDFQAAVRTAITAENFHHHEAPKPPTRFELCFEPEDWTDRAEALLILAEHLASPQPRPIMIVGPSGSGKTALAGVAAARARQQYPDGVIHAEPARHGTEEELCSVLERLGEPVPSRPSGAPKLYRAAMDSKRMIVILDEPENLRQIEEFDPRERGVAYIVLISKPIGWSRARRVTLPPLDHENAMKLLDAAEPLGAEAVARLCEAVGGLPGTLVTVRNIAAGGAVGIEDLVRMAERHDDAALFLENFGSLGEAAQRIYRALSLLPQPDVEQSLLSWLDKTSPEWRPSEELKAAKLVFAVGEHRWRLRTRPAGADIGGAND